jgi:hypothetical protein
LLGALFILELLLLPESAHDAPCYRNVRGIWDIVFQLPTLEVIRERKGPSIFSDLEAVIPPVDVNKVLKKETEVIMARFNTLKHTVQVAVYPAVWICGLAFAIPYGCTYSPSFLLLCTG